MGTYINPGNSGFSEIADPDYVDKTGLIGLVNQTIGRKNKLTCITRPRRFGKSYAAKMLAAYYDCSCDSHGLFDHRAAAAAPGYLEYMNQYNVVCLDISGFLSTAQREGIPLRELPKRIVKAIQEDLLSLDPTLPPGKSLEDCMIQYAGKQGGRAFIFIIDEWDAVIREAKQDAEAQKRYLSMLRAWFKNGNFTPKAVAAAYMTGILPIKKDGSQSAISDFREYSVLNPGKYAAFTGFTESEVRELCKQSKLRFEDAKAWYDGYGLSEDGAIYNPYSVVCAAETGKCQSYWQKTSAAESLTAYVNMDFKGLQATIARLIAGEEIPVNVDSFQNDVETFNSKDDVLTLLVHLGYLTYQETRKTIRIPNEEVRIEFQQMLANANAGDKWAEMIRRSQKLLDDTIAGDGEAVAKAIEEIRSEQYAPQYYNNEQALRAVIKYAYFAAIGQYVKIEEMPSGTGIADVVYIPNTPSRLPAMIIELKWGSSPGGAIRQIKEKHYAAALKSFKGAILLVGISYDEKTKAHRCLIERA